MIKRLRYKGPFSVDYKERRSHARGVYPTQDTSGIQNRNNETRGRVVYENNSEIIRNIKNSTWAKGAKFPSKARLALGT